MPSFIDADECKPKPVVVLSRRAFNAEHGASVLAMITTAARSQWSFDVAIADLSVAGLRHRSVVRLKLLTLENAYRATNRRSCHRRQTLKWNRLNSCLGPLRGS